MKIKWGALVTDGRGKIGGQVASKNRSGAYLRTKVTPSNPQTIYQIAARAILAALSSGWRALTAAQRESWNNAVSDFTKTNVFGDTVIPSGKNLYTRLNALLATINVAAQTSAPAPVAIVEPVVVISTNTAGPTALGITAADLDTSQTYQVMVTPPQSAGKSFVKSEFRLLQTMAGNEAQPFDLSAAFVARFGNSVVGKKVFVRLIPVNTVTGQNGIGAKADTITA